MRFKEGDYVRIINRGATSADAKNGTYYPYFGGLTGTVDRVYDKEVCIRVDPTTLPEDVLKRHLEIQESIKRKWLDSLSSEARNRLTPDEERFELAYTLLVQSADLEKVKPSESKPAAGRGTRAPAVTVPKTSASGKKPTVSKRPETPQPPVKTREAKPPATTAARPSARTAAAKAARPKSKAEPRPSPKAAPKAAATKPAAKVAPKASAAKAAKVKPAAESAKVAPKPPAKPPARASTKAETTPKSAKASVAKREAAKAVPRKSVTTADLNAAELAFLKERQRMLKGKM